MKVASRRIIFLFLISTILIIFLLPIYFVLADSSTKSPGAVVNTADGTNCVADSNNTWQSPSNLISQDDNYTEVTDNKFDNNDITERLDITNFSFDITADSTVNGIEVEIDKHESAGSAVDYFVKLFKAGSLAGDNKADTGTAWASNDSDSYTKYGGSTDLWGTAWTEGDIENTGFGVSVCAQASSNNTDVHIDHVRIIVYFTPPVADTEGPSAVTDLALSNAQSSSIDLSWTAPGDDGSTGTASSYDIRYSGSDITDENWSGATQVNNEPTPSIAGSSESMTVSDLLPDQTYHFGLKTSDEASNESDLSNTPSLVTSASGVSIPDGGGVAPTSVTFSGRAYPESSIEVLQRDSINSSYRNVPVETNTIDDDGNFLIDYKALLGGQYFFALRVEDEEGTKTGIISFNVNLLSQDKLIAEDIFVPPTLAFVRTAIQKGNNVEIRGYAAPNNDVVLNIGNTDVASTTTNTSGFYSFSRPTSEFKIGTHYAKTKQVDSGGLESGFSIPTAFKVSELEAPEADFNNDNKINITDWSIFLSRWGSDDSNLRLKVDLNADNKVDITDFSLFLRAINSQ